MIFNKDLKILLISDLHLTSNFDKRKFDFLRKTFASADQIILVGDFWDQWFTTFDKFLNSEWSHLFPILKSKNTIYICGNHDPLDKVYVKANVFCSQYSNTFEFDLPQTKYYVIHGDALTKNKHQRKVEFYIKIHKYIEKQPWRVIFYSTKNFIEQSIFKILGYKKFFQFGGIANHHNQTMKEYKLQKNQQNKEIYKTYLVCGDSHRPEIDEEIGYINTGFVKYGFASYVMIENAKPKLVIAKY
jgi:UDP-2,3-diacylglucosamine pyrophosphatase LpxH